MQKSRQTARKAWLFWLVTFSVIMLMSMLEFRILYLLHDHRFDTINGLHVAIAEGGAHWNVMQSRILGPYALTAIQNVLGIHSIQAEWLLRLGLSVAKNLVVFGCIFAALPTKPTNQPTTTLAAKLAVELTTKERRTKAWLATLIGCLLFIAIQHPGSLFLWDYLDVIAFTLFTYGVYQQKSWWFFALIIGLFVLNRESVLFISLWMVLSAFRLSFTPIRIGFNTNRWAFLIGGVLSGMICVGITLWLRETLQITPPSATQEFVDPNHATVWYSDIAHLTVIRNLAEIFVDNFRNPSLYLLTLVSVLAIGIPLHLFSIKAQWHRLNQAWALTYLAIFAASWLVALLNETRIFAAFIPFWLWFIVSIHLRWFSPQLDRSKTLGHQEMSASITPSSEPVSERTAEQTLMQTQQKQTSGNSSAT